MKVQNSVFGGLAIVLLIAFFLPWLSISAFFVTTSFSGASFPVAAKSALAFLLYLGPLMTLYLGFRAFTARPGRWSLRRLAMVVAGVNLGFALFFALYAVSAFTLAGGYWLHLLASGALLVCAFVLRQETEPSRSLLTIEQSTELKRRGQGLVKAAQVWVDDKRQEAERTAEQARIQQAVGRPLNRDILDIHDGVVAPNGSLVTHELIAEARRRGVLDLLLASVEVGARAAG